MAYTKVNWLNSGETGAKPINKTNLNQMDNGIYNNDANKLDKTAIKTEKTTSDTDTYSCNYMDNKLDTKQATILSGTSLPSTVENGAIFLLYS